MHQYNSAHIEVQPNPTNIVLALADGVGARVRTSRFVGRGLCNVGAVLSGHAAAAQRN